jgi:hypothetical protein
MPAETKNLRPICSLHCKQYESDAKLYIEEARPSGKRRLVVQYEKGGYGGRKEFGASIPDDWTEERVMELIFWPMNSDAPYPAWEVPARVYGSPILSDDWRQKA